MICKKCGGEFEPQKGLKNYCTLQCRNSREFSEEANKIKSEKAKQSWASGIRTPHSHTQETIEKLKKRVDWTCPVCSATISIRPFEARIRKFCSGTCRNNVNNKNISGTQSKAELYLQKELKESFPDLHFICNDRKVLNGLELDFYFPTLNLAIEWNGIWHFINARKGVKKRDDLKQKLCKELGIELLVIEDKTSHPTFIAKKTQEIITHVAAQWSATGLQNR
jgi:hypothetical protein